MAAVASDLERWWVFLGGLIDRFVNVGELGDADKWFIAVPGDAWGDLEHKEKRMSNKKRKEGRKEGRKRRKLLLDLMGV